MSAPRPRVVATLTARTVTAAREEAERAARAGADLVEIRLDRWSEPERHRAGELFPLPRPAIATLRSRAEGGEGPDAAEEREALLRACWGLPFRFVDLEIARDPLPTGDAAASGSDRLLLSRHLSETVPGPELTRKLAEAGGRGALVKVVEPATATQVLRDVLPYLPPAGGSAAIVHTTGGAGGLLRAWAGRLGLPAVFASLPEEGRTAPPLEESQIPCDRLAEFFAGATPAPIFAVVGRPVAFSRSPALHHGWMRRLGRRGRFQEHGRRIALARDLRARGHELDRRDRTRSLESEPGVGGHRGGKHPQRRDPGRGRVSFHRCRQDLAAHGPQARRADRTHRRRSA